MTIPTDGSIVSAWEFQTVSTLIWPTTGTAQKIMSETLGGGFP